MTEELRMRGTGDRREAPVDARAAGLWPGRKAIPALAGLSLLAVVISVLYAGVSHGDDTFIYLRYVRNLLDGYGLEFNPGEASYGVTSFIWTLMLTGPAWVVGPSVWAAKATSWSLFAVLAVVVWGILLRSGLSRRLALLMGACLLLEPHLLRWSGSGMENSLVALAVVLLLAAWPRDGQGARATANWAILAGLSPLIRPELAILAAMLFLEWGIAERDRPGARWWRAVALAGLTFGLGLLAARYFTGSWLPQTIEAKRLALRQVDPFYATVQLGKIVASGALPLVLAALASLRRPEFRQLVRPVLVYVGAVSLYLAIQNQLVATRYGVSLELPIVVAFLLATARTTHPLKGTLAAVLAQLALASGMLLYMYPATRIDAGEAVRGFAEGAKRLTTPADRIALTEVGAFGYFSNRYIVDLVGLVDGASLAWIRDHGRPRTLDELEALLAARCATHYVETFGAEAPLVGRAMRFEVVEDRELKLSNFSSGRVKVDRWRLYRLDWPGCR